MHSFNNEKYFFATNAAVIVDAVISDSNARAREFWLKSFKTKEGSIRDAVPWKEFAKVTVLL